MAARKTLTFVLMDAPYENARTTTALRLVDAAIRRGCDVNVFAYEGAVGLPFARQTPHANAVHGRDVAEEDHPNPKDWVAALHAAAEKRGSRLDWVQCGLCVDERGVTEWIAGPRRGSPADLVGFVGTSDNVLVIPTR
jgi:sulfur relay (sulfurtransferase) complex TusBCD TusD component (DsrE family)